MTPLQISVLKALENRNGSYISGEQLAGELEVSRTAVMKAVHSLRNQGYCISSVRRLGYKLDRTPDQLNAETIRGLLMHSGFNVDVQAYKTIDSTNNEGKRLAHNLKKPLLLLAEEQTMGRGRQGHSFYSPASTGLYMTIVVPSSLPLETIALCTQAMAVAAYRAVTASGGPELSIKWVNDLYLGEKKTAGILTEAVTDLETMRATAVVCGIGLNLTTLQFPDDIMNKAGSIGALDRNSLAVGITTHFLALFKELPDTSGWLKTYKERSLVLHKKLSFSMNGNEYQAVGKEIDDQGRLIVELEDGSETTLSSGEISIIPSFS